MPKQKRYKRKPQTLAKRALSTALAVKKLVGKPEIKYADIGSTTDLPDNTGQVEGNLVNITQGETGNLRIGNVITVKSMYLRLYAYQDASATNTAMRFAIVQDNQQVADTAPVWTDIFTENHPCSQRKNTSLQRFKVLADKMITFGDKKMYHTELYLKLNHVVRYNGIASTDIQKGGIYLLMVSNEVTNYPTVSWTYRVSFLDN